MGDPGLEAVVSPSEEPEGQAEREMDVRDDMWGSVLPHGIRS